MPSENYKIVKICKHLPAYLQAIEITKKGKDKLEIMIKETKAKDLFYNAAGIEYIECPICKIRFLIEDERSSN